MEAFYKFFFQVLDIVQAVGRAIRKAPNKKKGLILLPIFIDANEDPEINLEESCFKPIWKVLNALRAHDDILAEELDNLDLAPFFSPVLVRGSC